MSNTVLKEEEFIDSDVEEIKEIEVETDLISKLNSPINILLIILNIIVLIAIILVALLF